MTRTLILTLTLAALGTACTLDPSASLPEEGASAKSDDTHESEWDSEANSEDSVPPEFMCWGEGDDEGLTDLDGDGWPTNEQCAPSTDSNCYAISALDPDFQAVYATYLYYAHDDEECGAQNIDRLSKYLDEDDNDDAVGPQCTEVGQGSANPCGFLY